MPRHHRLMLQRRVEAGLYRECLTLHVEPALPVAWLDRQRSTDEGDPQIAHEQCPREESAFLFSS